MGNAYNQWIRIAVLNLLLVAVLGFIMRYKIVFSLPWVHQKHILHAHSHFAFSGWITQLLMIFMVAGFTGPEQTLRRYTPIFKANLLTAYGMLLSFPFQGYGWLSISCSTASILVSYWFAWQFWSDIKRQQPIAGNWFKAALLFLVMSSLGAFGLSFMMANHWVNQAWYLASVYFFLHFQYNGWFFFACMGLLFTLLGKYPQVIRYQSTIFRLFALACVPAYFLSVLWLSLPLWAYLLIATAALAQVVGCWLLFRMLLGAWPYCTKDWPVLARRTAALCFLALVIKLLLQLLSTIPALSDLAFGFRPIVIGYLHLVLLGIISLFLLTVLQLFSQPPSAFLLRKGVVVFVCSIAANEVLLMLQGLCAMFYIVVPYIQEALLLVALGLLTGAAMIFFSFRRPVRPGRV